MCIRDRSNDYSNETENSTLGTYNEKRRCWTSKLYEEDYKLSNKGYVFQFITLKHKIPIAKIIFRSAKLPMKEGEYENAPDNRELTTLTVYDFSESRGMQKELALNAPISSNSKIKWQSETCICDSGDLCNAIDNLTIDKNILLLSIIGFFNLSCVMLY